jgi:RNA polymerase sigma-70 factor (ECF subfamily)
LRSRANTLTGGLGHAEDLVQDTMLKAFQARERYTLGTNLLAWCFVIMRNQFLSEERKRRTRWARSLDEGIDPSWIQGAEGSQLSNVELGETLQAMDEMLPHEQAESLRMVGLEGCSYAEVAARLDVIEGTVKSRVSRARRDLNERLGSGRLSSRRRSH